MARRVGAGLALHLFGAAHTPKFFSHQPHSCTHHAPLLWRQHLGRGECTPALPPRASCARHSFSLCFSLTARAEKKTKQVLRVTAFSVGLVYGSWHLSSLKSRAARAKAAAEAASSGHH